MTHIVTWETYHALHPGGLTEAQFDACLPRAELVLETVTAGRAASASGYKLERARAAACLLCDAVFASDAALGEGGLPVASASSEGYSETYRLPESASESGLAALAARLLSGTGLAGAL